MLQTSALIKILKRSLKERGVTYADLTKPLELSEASIKRLFAEESFSLKRLDKICAHIGINMSELFNKLEQNMDFLSELTEDQEKVLVSDERHILVWNLVFSDWTFEDIIRIFTLTEPELIQSLVKLDKIGLIELLPNNRFKLLTAQNFTWRKNGPVQSFYKENFHNEFFNEDFVGEGANLTALTGMLSKEARLEFDNKVIEFAKEFDQLCKSDAKNPLDTRLGYGVAVAIKPWKLAFWSEYIR